MTLWKLKTTSAVNYTLKRMQDDDLLFLRDVGGKTRYYAKPTSLTNTRGKNPMRPLHQTPSKNTPAPMNITTFDKIKLSTWLMGMNAPSGTGIAESVRYTFGVYCNPTNSLPYIRSKVNVLDSGLGSNVIFTENVKMARSIYRQHKLAGLDTWIVLYTFFANPTDGSPQCKIASRYLFHWHERPTTNPS